MARRSNLLDLDDAARLAFRHLSGKFFNGTNDGLRMTGGDRAVQVVAHSGISVKSLGAFQARHGACFRIQRLANQLLSPRTGQRRNTADRRPYRLTLPRRRPHPSAAGDPSTHDLEANADA